MPCYTLSHYTPLQLAGKRQHSHVVRFADLGQSPFKSKERKFNVKHMEVLLAKLVGHDFE